ncbi:MAG TPA: type IV pilus twitching motility protein PilT [Armatimonadota bacterium]
MDIADLLILAPQMGASDIHLTVGAQPALRVHGRIQRLPDCPVLSREVLRTMLYDILTDTQKAKFEEQHELDFAVELQGVGRYRVNAFMNRSGEGAVFRSIPDKIKGFEELGLPDVVRQLARCDKGLVLVTGPTGSGKSTTLAAMIDLINTERQEHILTVEDPIEFVHPHKNCIVNQREVGPHTHSFENALRSALREDPDVIMVGEMRDLETIALAITAAETGHLVFGTLHTMGAPQTVDRVIDVFPTDQQSQIRAQFAESIRGVVSQILMRRADGSGRVAALEIMVANSAIRNLIREGKTFQMHSVIETCTRDGMCTLDQSLKELVKSGRVTKEDALAKATDPDSLESIEADGARRDGGGNGMGGRSLDSILGSPISSQQQQPSWGKKINY